MKLIRGEALSALLDMRDGLWKRAYRRRKGAPLYWSWNAQWFLCEPFKTEAWK